MKLPKPMTKEEIMYKHYMECDGGNEYCTKCVNLAMQEYAEQQIELFKIKQAEVLLSIYDKNDVQLQNKELLEKVKSLELALSGKTFSNEFEHKYNELKEVADLLASDLKETIGDNTESLNKYNNLKSK